MLFEFDVEQKAKIKLIGVGGAGGNAVNRMIHSGMDGVDFIVINTDAQDLENNEAKHKIQIGKNLTKGLGAGAKSEIGKAAVENDQEAIKSMLEGADMVFITAGMGGGTGTGAAPVIAQLSHEMDILTVGIATLPFNFEGPKRMDRAHTGISELRKACDTLIVIPNQKLMSIVERNTTLTDAFKMADSILHQAASGISDLINVHGMINLDFADVETIMKNMGEAIMGTGIASGEERAVLAAQQAISSPLLDNGSIAGAQGVLVNITGGEDVSLHEVDDATSIIFEEAGEDANIIFGAVIDPKMKDKISVTVIATGFNRIPEDQSTSTYKKQEGRSSGSETGILADKMNEPIHSSIVSGKRMEEKTPREQPAFFFDDTKSHMDVSADLEIPAFIRRQHK